MKSEFIAIDKSGKKAKWLHYFTKDIPKRQKPVSPICIYCDNQYVIGRV